MSIEINAEILPDPANLEQVKLTIKVSWVEQLVFTFPGPVTKTETPTPGSAKYTFSDGSFLWFARGGGKLSRGTPSIIVSTPTTYFETSALTNEHEKAQAFLYNKLKMRAISELAVTKNLPRDVTKNILKSMKGGRKHTQRRRR